MVLGLILLAIIVVFGFLLIGAYNRLVALRQNVNEAFADIDVQLKQRQDLVPNLVETVKGYAAHERGTLDEVTAARTAAAGAGNVEQRAQAENVLTSALGKLMAVAEAYPDLKANQNFTQLQNQLSDLENKIAAARRFFNNLRRRGRPRRPAERAASEVQLASASDAGGWSANLHLEQQPSLGAAADRFSDPAAGDGVLPDPGDDLGADAA
jgi:LemA protein